MKQITRIAVAGLLSLALLATACSDDTDVTTGDSTTTTAPGDHSGTVPGTAPDITGTVTAVTPFVPITEDCTPPEDLDPDDVISSDDPPVCSDPDTDVVGTILVEETPGGQGDRKIAFTITTSTVLAGSTTAPLAAFDDLTEGQTVEGWTTGQCAESYPEQCGAVAIRRTA